MDTLTFFVSFPPCVVARSSQLTGLFLTDSSLSVKYVSLCISQPDPLLAVSMARFHLATSAKVFSSDWQWQGELLSSQCTTIATTIATKTTIATTIATYSGLSSGTL